MRKYGSFGYGPMSVHAGYHLRDDCALCPARLKADTQTTMRMLCKVTSPRQDAQRAKRARAGAAVVYCDRERTSPKGEVSSFTYVIVTLFYVAVKLFTDDKRGNDAESFGRRRGLLSQRGRGTWGRKTPYELQ